MILPCEQRSIMRESDDGGSFKGAHFPKEVMLMGVHWYVAYPLTTTPSRSPEQNLRQNCMVSPAPRMLLPGREGSEGAAWATRAAPYAHHWARGIGTAGTRGTAHGR